MNEQFSTKKQTAFIKQFFAENEKFFNLSAISERYTSCSTILSNLIHADRVNLQRSNIEGLRPFFAKFNITIPEEVKYFEFLICNKVSEFYKKNVEPKRLCLKNRKNEIVIARQICILYCFLELKQSQNEATGNYNQHHSSRDYSRRHISNLYDTDVAFRSMIIDIEKSLNCKLIS